MFLTTAFAATAYQKSITVDYNINLEINGETPTLTDVNGKQVRPFTYEGTTYVPIRAVANEMGASVGYDNATQTATITQSPNDDAEEYLYFLGLASYASNKMKDGSLMYFAAISEGLSLSSYYSSSEHAVQKAKNYCISNIMQYTPYYEESAMVCGYLNQMMDWFGVIEQSYQLCLLSYTPENINAFSQAQQKLFELSYKIDDMLLEGATNQF